jgi:tripartite-type tricarboxylate transporter receptor subunit TctC
MKRRENNMFKYLSFLACTLSLLFTVCLEISGGAEKFPTRPVELIIPAAPGGGTDIMARILAEATEPFLGQKLVVINKPGGSGTIGLNVIAQAKADGYSLGCVYNSPMTMVPHVLKVNFTVENFSYISMIAKGPMLFCVRAEFPAKTAEEFFEYVRKNQGKLTYAGDGVGNIVHFSGERVFHAMKVKLRLVPYGGAGESIKALLGGHVDVYGGTVPPAAPHIKAGTVRPLFITMKERIDSLPGVVGVSELGTNVPETPIWRGIIGPKGIPTDRIEILEKVLQQAAQTQKVKDHLKQLGETVVIASGKQFEEQVREEIAAMAIAAKELGLSPK